MARSIGTYLNLCTPKGRIVTGPLYQLNKTEWRNGQQVPIPQDKWRYKFGLAIPKSDPATAALMGAIYNHALNTYSSNEIAVRNGVVAAIQKGLQKRSGFSWKIYDGDVPNEITGKKPKNCEGCYVIPFELPEFIKGRPARFETYRWDNQPIDWEEVKLGFEVDVAFSVIDNGLLVSVPGGASAGMYFNAKFVRYLGTGEEIVFGPSIDQIMAPAKAPPMKGFGAAPAGNGFAGSAEPATPKDFGGISSTSTMATPTAAISAAPAPSPTGFPATPVNGGFTQQPHPEMISGRAAGFPDVQANATQVAVQGPGFPNGASASAETVYRSSSVPGFDEPA